MAFKGKDASYDGAVAFFSILNDFLAFDHDFCNQSLMWVVLINSMKP